jgi:protein-tyrosine phosphatase
MNRSGSLWLPNLRDIGGYPTLGGGRVRRGVLYRSSALAGLSSDQMRGLKDLGLRAVFDLRSVAERQVAPDDLPPGVSLYPMDVLSGTSSFSPDRLAQLLSDPAGARRALQGRKASEVSEERFRELVRLESARQGWRTLYTSLTEPSRRPALVHCSTGRDRTGWAVAALLALLGVAREHIVHDYLVSDRLLEPLVAPGRRSFVDRGGDDSLFASLAGARRENLDAAFDEAERVYGSLENYYEDGLGMDATTRGALQASLVEHEPEPPARGVR